MIVSLFGLLMLMLLNICRDLWGGIDAVMILQRCFSDVYLMFIFGRSIVIVTLHPYNREHINCFT